VALSRCSSLTRAGQPCRAWAAPGGRLCIFHDPAHREQARRIQANGARKSNRLRSIRGARAKLDSAVGLLKFAGTLVHRIVEGEIEPETARSALYGIAICQKLVEVAEIEKRMRAIEAQQGRRWRA
jgi:hypothetical protein